MGSALRGPTLFGLALAIRLFYILVIAPEPVGVGGDASFYHSAANLLADGHFYERRIFGHAYQTALHPPLFSIVLSPVALLGGVHVLPQRIVGCVIGAINVVLVGALGRDLAGARAGRIAAALALVYPPFITADGSLQSEPLYVLLLLCTLLVAVSTWQAPTVRRAAALGALIGLATLARTEAFLLLPLLGWVAVCGASSGRPGRIAASIAACAIVLAPWVVRNDIVFHKLTLAGNYDTVIPAANCRDTYYGHDIGWWSLNCLAHARTHHQLLIGDASPNRGLTYIRHHPARAVLVAGVRVLRTFSLYQPLRIGNHEPRRKWVDLVGVIMYYPLLVFAGFGIARTRGRGRWLLLAPVFTALIATITGWGNARFRIGADVAIVVFAAVKLAGVRRSRAREAPAHGGRERLVEA
jgi:4-amino-4-deoxy-L-arabinose transferase-like glycosyltransferase